MDGLIRCLKEKKTEPSGALTNKGPGKEHREWASLLSICLFLCPLKMPSYQNFRSILLATLFLPP